jgi:hypothetical protein
LRLQTPSLRLHLMIRHHLHPPFTPARQRLKGAAQEEWLRNIPNPHTRSHLL